MISGSLFTRDYLLEGIRGSPQWAGLADASVANLKQAVLKQAQSLTAGVNPNEAQTEKDFIYPVLALLGWTDVEVQQTLSKKGRKQVPDALLFANNARRNLAVAQKDPWKRYQFGLSVVEAKRWARALDRADKKEAQEEGVPSTQMLSYLRRVDVVTGGKVRLGILTNGVKWRLYFQGALSVSEDYFEVDLAKALELPKHELDLVDLTDARMTRDHVFKLFVLMFGKQAFLPAEGALTFHDLSRQAGKLWEEKVTKDLSALVFDELFPMLVANLHKLDNEKPATIDAAYLEGIRQSALILLYRLLFVVYAEDRDLLPDKQEPYKSYSLTTVRLEVAEGMKTSKVFSQTHATYWPKLTAVFTAIAEGDDALGIPPYNGGLFARDTAPLLQRIVLPDAVVAELVFKLSHRADEKDGAPRFINYRDLSVQQLGTIYERTLEYGLKYEKGAVTVDADDTARHQSGSYYTPDSLVSLIIEKTVGPLVEECREAFRKKNDELAKDSRRPEIKLAELQGFDTALAMLELRICDPAMGSGHFLVNLVDWLADKTLAAIAEAEQLVDWSETPYRSPVLGNIEQTRIDIIRQATKHKWPFVIEHLDDRHIIRRTILKRCIYGVDKNPMAVELSKVALWLHTFTVGAPLSFLDHHLRQGNSLFGFWVKDAIDRLVKWGGQLLINEPMQKAMAQAMAMQKLERVNDIDIGEVHQSKTIFDGIEQETRPFNTFVKVLYALDWMKLDKEKQSAVKCWLDGQFGDPFDIARGKILLGSSDGGDGTVGAKDGTQRIPAPMRKAAEVFAGVLNEAREIVRRERFHNWQIAFPGVWDDWGAVELKGGFDAVIGNPPYVRHGLIKPIKPALKRSFAQIYNGTADLFVFFMDQGLKLLKPGGRLSYVLTNKWLRASYAEALRRKLSSEAWIEFVADFGHAKGFFPDADVFPSVFVARRPNTSAGPDETLVSVIPRDDVPDKGLEAAVAKATFARPRSSFGGDRWVLEPERVMSLLEKLYAAGATLSEYANAQPLAGIKTGLNKAYVVSGETRARLIDADATCEELIRPYLRGQDVKRWRCGDSGLYMIVMKSSADRAWLWAKAGDDAEKLFSKTYPALHKHFKQFETELKKREDQGRYWWELRPSQNYSHFEGDFIAYQDIAFHSAFAISRGVVPEMTAFCLPMADDPYLLAVLNSPLMWYVLSRITLHGKDEALRLKTDKMLTIPIAEPSKKIRTAIEPLVSELQRLASSRNAAVLAMADWLQHSFAIDRDRWKHTDFTSLEADEFVAAVSEQLPKRQKLTAAQVQELKREYTATLSGARKARAQTFTLESKLSDLVNQAYGLTRDDIDLMWDTAPLRMPFTPKGLAVVKGPAAPEDTDDEE